MVLIAEDDEDIRELVALRVARAGYAVLTAANGEQALRLVLNEKPDIALLDVMMPRLTGIEVTRRIRAAEGPIRTVPILLISARAGESDINEGLAAGADGYLKKPFDTHELHDRLQTIVQRHR